METVIIDRSIEDYSEPMMAIREFSRDLADFTGAQFAIPTDSCTHAIELCLRLVKGTHFVLPHQTYLSLPMLMHKLGVEYTYDPHIDWAHQGEYRIAPTNVWDSARKFKKGMYRKGQLQCLSFGHGKPLTIGTGGAILTDNVSDAAWLSQMAYDGRKIDANDNPFAHWSDQRVFNVGYHYMMRPEFAVKGINLLKNLEIVKPSEFNYPDLQEITIVSE